MDKQVKITVAIPTYNEEAELETCLNAVFRQKYPLSLLEVLIVDNYSIDKTLQIARKYPVKILMNKIKDAQISKMIALRKSHGELFMYLDADLEILGSNWFDELSQPLLNDPKIVGSFTKFVSFPSDAPLCRYLSYETIQKDPIYEFFSASVESTIIERKGNYAICEYATGKIPSSGLCLFKKKALLSVWNLKKDKKFMELDNLVKLVNAGYNKFAYVPGPGMHHPFVKNLNDIFRKRLRNIRKNYLNQDTPRLYTWFDLKTVRGILKVFLWMIYVNTFVLPILRGIRKSIRNKDWACMYEPILAFLETWVIIYGFIKYGYRLPFGNKIISQD